MAEKIKVGDRVRFRETLPSCGFASWTAPVVKVDGDRATVKMPERATTFKFSPYAGSRDWSFPVEELAKAIVR